MSAHDHIDIPEIIVDDFPATPPTITRDITSPGQTPIHRFGDSDTPTAFSPNILQSPDVSFVPDTPSRHRPLQRRQRTSDVSMLSIDMSSRYVDRGQLKLQHANSLCRLDSSMSRESRSADDDELISSMQNSMWKGMLSIMIRFVPSVHGFSRCD